jgi:hypothetical protein
MAPGTHKLESWVGLKEVVKRKVHGRLSSLREYIGWKMLLAAGAKTNSQSQ